MVYDEFEKVKQKVKRRDRQTMDWMVLFAIIIALGLIYLPIKKPSSSIGAAESEKTEVTEISLIKPPEPPPEQQIEEKIKKKKKQVLAKPIPEPEIDNNEPLQLDDENVELVFDAAEIDFEEPEAPPEGPLRVGGDVKKPEIVKRIPPVYPDIARRAKIQGVVIVEAIITKNGDVIDAKVLKSLHSLCDQAAIDAVMQWKFKPGTQNDIPVDVIMVLTVEFRLQ